MSDEWDDVQGQAPLSQAPDPGAEITVRRAATILSNHDGRHAHGVSVVARTAGVAVGMGIDEARRHHEIRRVDVLAGLEGGGDLADVDDRAV